jgi:hypothetical protein
MNRPWRRFSCGRGRRSLVDREDDRSYRWRSHASSIGSSLHIDYKSTKVKQYHKLDQALRTEPTPFLTRVHKRLIGPGLSDLLDHAALETRR